MDQGASPFADPDAIAAMVAEEHGIEEEDIDRTQDVPGVIGAMHRANMDRDASSIIGGPVMGGGPSEADLAQEEALRASFDNLKEAGEAEPGCICDYSQDLTHGFGGPVKRHLNPKCPAHGDGARQEYDVDGTAEEF